MNLNLIRLTSHIDTLSGLKMFFSNSSSDTLDTLHLYKVEVIVALEKKMQQILRGESHLLSICVVVCVCTQNIFLTLAHSVLLLFCMHGT